MVIKNKQTSFTLIELLVVIVIIGILAGVIMISTSSSINKANIAKSKVFAESIKNNLLVNLISEFKFDEESGASTKDSWSGSLVGTISGFTNTSASFGDSNSNGWMSESNCISKTCLKFNSSQSITTTPSFPAIRDNSFTWEFWGGTDKSSTGTGIFLSISDIPNWQGKLDYPHSTTNKALFYIKNSCYRYSTKFINDNNWHHVVGVFDRNKNTPDIYIDGKLDNGTSNGNDCLTIETIGSGNLSLGNSFKGVLDEVKMYNEALSSSQIKQNYIAGLDSLLSKASISKEDYNERINTLAYDN